MTTRPSVAAHRRLLIEVEATGVEAIRLLADRKAYGKVVVMPGSRAG